MNLEKRIERLERTMNGTTENEEERIYQYIKAKNPMTMGPNPVLGWDKPSRPWSDEGIRARARWLYSHFHTLDAVKEREVLLEKWRRDGAKVLEDAIKDIEARRQRGDYPSN